jgi:hypothetical protein
MLITEDAIKKYIDCIKTTSSANDFFKFNTYLFEKSLNFDEKNILITLKSRKELPLFLQSILGYVKNKYELIQKTTTNVNTDDLVLYNDFVWKVIDIDFSSAKIVKLFENIETDVSKETVIPIEKEDCKYKKVNFKTFNSNNGNLYLKYIEWLSIIKQKYSHSKIDNSEERKQNRILVIVSGKRDVTVLKENGDIPFVYDKEQSNACTSYEPVVDIFSSFDIANNTRMINSDYNEIYIIGDRNIEKHLSDLIKITDKERIERFVIIGTKKPETSFELVEWHWTKEEYNAWSNKKIIGNVRLKITDEQVWNNESNGVSQLKEIVNQLIDSINQLKIKYSGISISKIYYFINEYMRYLLPANHAYLYDIQEKITEYLNEEGFIDAFYDKAIFDQQEINNWKSNFEEKFNKLHNFFVKHSPKYNHITSGLKNKTDFEQFTGGRYTITKRELIEKANGCNDLHDNERKISAIPLYDSQKNSFDKIVDSDLNAESAQFIFPFIFNRSQYESMLEANGDVKLYLYKDIEDFKFVKVMEANEERFSKKIYHSDRSKFINCKYIIPEIVVQEEKIQDVTGKNGQDIIFREYQTLSDSKKDFFKGLYEIDNVDYLKETREYNPNDTTEYEVKFADDEILTLSGSRRVILIDENRHVTVPVAGLVTGLEAGLEIIVYRNLHKDLLYEILKKHDASGLIKEIERASNLWFSTIREIDRRNNNDVCIIMDLLNRKNIYVTEQTLYGYLKHDRKFPKETEMLEAIRNIAVEQNLSDNYLKNSQQLENIIRRKKQYHSLTITLGRDISAEVTKYYFTGRKGVLLERLDDEVVDVLKLNIKRGEIKSVTVKK